MVGWGRLSYCLAGIVGRACGPRDVIGWANVVPDLFIELFGKVMMPKARLKLCIEWNSIRSGKATVHEARTRIPRPDLAFAAYKAECIAKSKAATATGQNESM